MPVRVLRRVVAWLGALFIVAAAFVLLLVIISPPPGAFVTAIVVIVMVVAPTAAGLWLVRSSEPGFLPAMQQRLAQIGTSTFWLALPQTLAGAISRERLAQSPLRRAVLGVVIAIVGFVVMPKGGRWIGEFAVFTTYAVVDPAVNAFRPRWWLNAGKSLVGFLLLFILAAIVAEADKMREAGMIFVLPLMIYPFALGISGVIRLVWFHLPPA